MCYDNLRSLRRRANVAMSVVLLSCLMAVPAVEAAQPQDTAGSVSLVPEDAAFYTATLRNKEQINILLESNAFVIENLICIWSSGSVGSFNKNLCLNIRSIISCDLVFSCSRDEEVAFHLEQTLFRVNFFCFWVAFEESTILLHIIIYFFDI